MYGRPTLCLLIDLDGTGGTLTGTNDTFKDSEARNGGVVPIAVNTPGRYQIVFTVAPAVPDDPIPEPLTSKIFTVKFQAVGK